MKPVVMVVGDLMLDIVHVGTSRRFSAEAPNAPVMLFSHDLVFPGGAANVAANIISLGGEVVVVGAVGRDESAAALVDMFNGYRQAIVVRDDAPTTLKMRMVCDGRMLMRVDYEKPKLLSDRVSQEMVSAALVNLETVGAIVLSDYAKGAITPGVAKALIAAARRRGVPVIVDTKTPVADHFRGATVIKPNLPEIAAALGLSEPPQTGAEAGAAARALLDRCEAAHIVLTRGADGLCVANADGVSLIAGHHVDCVDVTGAGDAVCAALALKLAQGASIERAAQFANAAGAVAVAKRGTYSATFAEVEALEAAPADRVDAQAFASQDAAARRFH